MEIYSKSLTSALYVGLISSISGITTSLKIEFLLSVIVEQDVSELVSPRKKDSEVLEFVILQINPLVGELYCYWSSKLAASVTSKPLS